jgi:enterochelin esterase-like enzyme
MNARPDGDRLAVRTFVDDGEEIPCGYPSVTDAERAAAGLETIADRWQVLLPGNRSRAAAQYSAGGLPDGQDAVRVWWPREAAELRGRLGERPLAAWMEDSVLHVLWRGRADEVRLGGGVQPRLWPVTGTDDLWEASLRIRRLEEAVITIVVMLRRGDQPGQTADMLVWRGPRAPAALPAAQELQGVVEEHTLDGAALGAPRQVTVYHPPGPAGPPLRGCVFADGQSAGCFARVLEPAILAGSVPPVLLVGVHNGASVSSRWPDRRTQEYVPGHSRRRFGAHLAFVTGEVIPWACGRFGPVEGPWVAAGFSNGAAWAIAAGQRRPDVFGSVAAFSPSVVPRRISAAARAAGIRHYLAAGTFETGFRQATGQWARRLRAAGLPCHHEEWIGGHDAVWWKQQLPAALGWLLPAQ